MTKQEQKKLIITFVQKWTGSKEEALKWYESQIIPAFKLTAQQAVDKGHFKAVEKYLNHIEKGGFA